MVIRLAHYIILFIFSLGIFLTDQTFSMNVKTVDYTVYEGSQRDIYVGNLKEDTLIENEIAGKLTFKFDNEGTSEEKYFRVDKNTGKLYVLQTIDREAMCADSYDQNSNCVYQLAVYVPEETWINVNIVIKDINDHRPFFSNNSYIARMTESSKVGHTIYLQAAVDKDAPPNNVQDYSISCDKDQVFKVRFDQSNPYQVDLVTLVAVDHETKSKYHCRLLACDGGQPKKCGAQNVTIDIIDENDNKPTFELSEYKVDIQEDLQVGKLVLKVVAKDADSGQNGELWYRFRQFENQKVIQHFSIDRNSGEIKLKKKLDAKLTSSFKFTIEAVDKGMMSFVGKATVHVKVIDLNDKRPSIQIKPQPSILEVVSVKENEKVGYPIALITVTDGDLGKNGEVNCSIETGAQNFKLEDSNQLHGKIFYRLVTRRVFDKEEERNVSLQILCIDHGTPPRRNSQELVVQIIDRNEFPPEFKTNYTANVAENLKEGTHILTVKAVDRDVSAYLQYSLSAEGNSYFSIDPDSGSITAKENKLDREITPKISFHVLANDNREPIYFTATAAVTVTLMDVNDNYPTLAGKTFNVTENQIYYKPIVTLSATDKDNGNNGTVNFKILNITGKGGARQSLDTFIIDTYTGEIRVNRKLDREENDYYHLNVSLYDLGSPPRSTVETVRITVLDENDNFPTWMFPNADNLVINKTSPVSTGDKIAQLKATDFDAGENGNVSYHLLSDTENFHLNRKTGELIATKLLKLTRYYITVKASDNGKRPLEKEAKLQINIFPGGSLLADRQNRARLNFTLVVSMVIATCVVSVALLIAIFIVRKRFARGRRDDNLRKWAQDNVYVDGWSRPGYFGPPASMHGYVVPDMLPKDVADICGNAQTLYIRPMTDTEVASADSGHCAGEEENQYHPDSKVSREYRPMLPAHMMPGTMRGCRILPEDSSVQCGCQEYMPMTSVHSGTVCPPSYTSSMSSTFPNEPTNSATQISTPTMRTFPRPMRPPVSLPNDNPGSPLIDKVRFGTNGTLPRPSTPRQTNL